MIQSLHMTKKISIKMTGLKASASEFRIEPASFFI